MGSKTMDHILLLAPTVASDGILCACGARLLDAVDDRFVTVEGRTFPFRRTTDQLLCATCPAIYPVAVVREAVALAA
jgi:hypothetical protein